MDCSLDPPPAAYLAGQDQFQVIDVDTLRNLNGQHNKCARPVEDVALPPLSLSLSLSVSLSLSLALLLFVLFLGIVLWPHHRRRPRRRVSAPVTSAGAGDRSGSRSARISGAGQVGQQLSSPGSPSCLAKRAAPKAAILTLTHASPPGKTLSRAHPIRASQFKMSPFGCPAICCLSSKLATLAPLAPGQNQCVPAGRPSERSIDRSVSSLTWLSATILTSAEHAGLPDGRLN